jgi:hypothetical protein
MSDFDTPDQLWSQVDPTEFLKRAIRHEAMLTEMLAGDISSEGDHIDTIVKIDFQKIILEGGKWAVMPEWFSAVLLGLEEGGGEGPEMVVGDVESWLFVETEDPDKPIKMLIGIVALEKVPLQLVYELAGMDAPPEAWDLLDN